MTKTRKLTTMAMLIALSVVFVWLIHFPIIPVVPFLEYDPADIPILISTFVFGPLAGFVVTVIASVIQGLTVSAASSWYGIVMHILATGAFVLVAGNIYKRKKTRKWAALSMLIGVAAELAVMVGANLLITPAFMGVPTEVVSDLLLPGIIPFNLIKFIANALIVFIIYKPISNLIKLPGKKKAVVAKPAEAAAETKN